MNQTEHQILLPFRKIYQRYFANRSDDKITHYAQPIVSELAAHQWIVAALQQEHPFMISRLGAVELNCLVNYCHIQAKDKHSKISQYHYFITDTLAVWKPDTKHSMHNNAGFYPPQEAYLERFCELYFADLGQVDLMGVWYNREEDAIINRFAPQANLTELENLEPYYHPEPWSKYLAGKKVLVIHPFSDSIKAQFAKRHLLFPHSEVLPDFELKTLKAVQSIAGERPQYPDWFAALEAMCQQMQAIDFEVAIIGAGAYGLPLAAHAKRLGKQAIHLGGATQILFGIKGKRWDEMPKIAKFYNEAWIRPLESERPANAVAVEGACYW